MIGPKVLYMIAVLPPLVGGYWYRGRLREVREAREENDLTAKGIRELDELVTKVTREGWLLFGAVVVYWGLLSILF